MSRPWAIPRPGGTHGELGRGSRTYPRSQHPYMQRRQPLNSGFADGTDRSGEQLPQHLRRQKVSYPTSEQPGTIIVDTANTYLYLILGGGEAIRYGIGVGREGFTWAGRERVTRKAKWPQWRPPQAMLQRDPSLPAYMPGGLDNPLGARALYLGRTLYRIHGTNEPATIGQYVSSGCIRLRNADVIHLYDRVSVGANVIVLPASR